MVNVVPLAPTLTEPPSNGYVVYSDYLVFGWVFNDPGDYQSHADFRFKQAGDAAWTTLPDVATTLSSYTQAPGIPDPDAYLLHEPFQYEWQVRTTDSLGQVSPWSESWFFNTIAAVPDVTITDPANSALVVATPVTVSWTLPAGFTQDAYRVMSTEYDDGTGEVYYDSGVVESTVQTMSAPLPAGGWPGRAEAIRVIFRYNGWWSYGNNRVEISNQALLPETPLVVLAQVPGRPEVEVSIMNPSPSDASHVATVSCDLTRDGVRIAKDLPPNSSFTDLLPGAGDVSYTVTAYSASGGTATSF